MKVFDQIFKETKLDRDLWEIYDLLREMHKCSTSIKGKQLLKKCILKTVDLSTYVHRKKRDYLKELERGEQ